MGKQCSQSWPQAQWQGFNLNFLEPKSVQKETCPSKCVRCTRNEHVTEEDNNLRGGKVFLKWEKDGHRVAGIFETALITLQANSSVSICISTLPSQ